jgi:Fe(3+) dicitrate transport protein
MYQVAGLEPRVTTTFLTGPVAHTVDTGARVLVETSRYDQRAGDTPYSTAGNLVNQEEHTTYAFAGYVQDRLAFTDKLLVTPGFRVEQAQFSRDLTRVSTGTTTAMDAFIHGDTSSTGLIPGIGIIYGTRRLHAFAGMHVGWAPPRIVDAVTARGTPSQVDAEQSYNYELGARASTPKWLRAEGTLFYSLFTNQVVTGSSGDVTQLVNGGHTKHVGVEGTASIALGKLLEVPKTAIDIGARYTFVHATFEDPPNQGNIIPYSPEHTVGGTLDVDHEIGVGGQAAWYWVSPQFTDSNDTVTPSVNGSTGRIPSYNVLDINAHYRHQPTGLTLKLIVKGVLDDIYISERRPNGIHQAGYREIMLGLRWDYEKLLEPGH